MGKRKSNASGAAQALESSVPPILEVNFEDPLFTAAAHPTKPLLITGFATGHLYCTSYDAENLEQVLQVSKEKSLELQQRAYESGKIPHVNKSVSQLKTNWWTTFKNIKEIPSEESYVKTNWKTKRHKGSCRHAIFDPRADSLGEFIYTCGTDNIIKKAATETGKVVSKVDVALHYFSASDRLTKLCHSTTHPFLLSGTEDGHVLVYDSSNLAANNKLKFKVEQAHSDSINHILSMSSSPYHYLTLGATTLSHIDVRKGTIVTQSDDQEDELLSMCYTTDEISEGRTDTVLVAHGEGLITLWKNSKNKLMDQLSRIKVNKNASIDAIVPTMNNDDETMANSVWCGDSDGFLHRVDYKRGKVVETRVHSTSHGKSEAVDEVGILDIDFDYRLISAGMDALKIWSNRGYEEADAESDSDGDSNSNDNESDSNGDESDSDDPSGKSDLDGVTSDEEVDLEEDEGEDKDEEEDDDDDEKLEELEELEETKLTATPFKRKRRDLSELITKPKKKQIDINKLTRKASEEEEEKETDQEPPSTKRQKFKEKKLTAKQLKNMQRHEHGIRKFEGL
ncbi:uncharacterized protein LODBEIA_P06600 [Lodderomyces beijingensis]|uniref:WD repeat-containing protein JIP5 n=1 Tax=Lodderomyces beijingensis TaxID=1775926 RepID=A0ABP0ZHY3_9ASCO